MSGHSSGPDCPYRLDGGPIAHRPLERPECGPDMVMTVVAFGVAAKCRDDAAIPDMTAFLRSNHGTQFRPQGFKACNPCLHRLQLPPCDLVGIVAGAFGMLGQTNQRADVID